MKLRSEIWVGRSTSLWLFFVLTFVITWSFWLAAALVAGEAGLTDSPLRLQGILLYLGVFTPALVALGLTASSGGGAGVYALLRRLVDWQVPGRWYVFAVAYMASIRLAAAGLYRVVTGAWPAFGFATVPLLLVATAFSTLIGGQVGEELGWRGYALPGLSARMGLRWASIVLGVFWAFWHLPLFFVTGPDKMDQSFPLYAIGAIGLSVAFAWLYAHTRGSLLLTMLLHAAVNNTKDIVPTVLRPGGNPFSLAAPLLGWLTAGVIWAAALYFLVTMPSQLEAGNA